jgi:hypothetical protein
MLRCIRMGQAPRTGHSAAGKLVAAMPDSAGTIQYISGGLAMGRGVLVPATGRAPASANAVN